VLALLQGDEPVVDPELGRVIEPWRTGQVDLVREALLRYGPDRMDKVVQQVSHACWSQKCVRKLRLVLRTCPLSFHMCIKRRSRSACMFVQQFAANPGWNSAHVCMFLLACRCSVIGVCSAMRLSP
jgi:hypothetical protein